MATIYVGPASNGFTYTTAQAAINVSSPNDTIMIAPGSYSDRISSIPHSLTIKGNVPDDFNYEPSGKGTWPVVFTYSTSNACIFYGTSTGITEPADILIESIEFAGGTGTYSVCVSNGGPYLNMVMNKCYSRDSHCFYGQGEGVAEVRNSYFGAGKAAYSPSSMGGSCNVIKSVFALENPRYEVTPSGWVFNINDSVLVSNYPAEGYGPEYGNELSSRLYHRIKGVLRDSGRPIRRVMMIIDRTTGKILSQQTSGVDGSYDFDCRTFINKEITLVVREQEGSSDSQSIVVDRITPGDPRT